jgi:hypothetical protein
MTAMTWPSWLPANRIASLAAFLTGIGAALAGLESWGGLPTGVASTIVTVTGIIGSIVTCLHFMLGSQKSEALATARPPSPIITPPKGTIMAAIDDFTTSIAALQAAVAAETAELQKLVALVQASSGGVTPDQAAGIVAQVAQVATDAQDAVNAAEAALNPAPAA